MSRQAVDVLKRNLQIGDYLERVKKQLDVAETVMMQSYPVDRLRIDFIFVPPAGRSRVEITDNLIELQGNLRIIKGGSVL